MTLTFAVYGLSLGSPSMLISAKGCLFKETSTMYNGEKPGAVSTSSWFISKIPNLVFTLCLLPSLTDFFDSP